MKRTISSAFTMLSKCVIPVMIVVLVIVEAWVMFSEDSLVVTLVVMPVSIIAIASLWLCVPLKRVQIDDETLYISNYIRTIAVPFSEIESIKENKLFSTHPIWITLRNPTAFGKTIMFSPSWCPPFSSHPIVDELRRLADAAENGEPKRV